MPPSRTPSTSNAIWPQLKRTARFAPTQRARVARWSRQLETFGSAAFRKLD
jgi:hypothetical protein